MKNIISIASNAVVGKLVNADREALLAVSLLLSYEVEGFEQTTTYKSGRWDGRSSLFNYNSASFPAGFCHRVQAHLSKLGYTVNRVRKPLPLPLGPENPVVDDFGNDPKYDYQPEVMGRLLKHGQIIAQVATGGGKSRIAKLCYARIQRPTLFLTTRGILMYQMKESFEGLGRVVGVLGDAEWSPRKGVNVGMVQTLAARVKVLTIEGEVEHFIEKERAEETAYIKKCELAAQMMKSTGSEKPTFPAFKRKTNKEIAAIVKPKVDEHMLRREKTIKILEVFEFIILEEAHEASGNSYFDIMKHCKNAYYRLALTATPFMKDSEEANMRLMACSGPVAIKVSEQLLIDRGILAKPYFKFIAQPDRPKGVYRTTGWQAAYKTGIMLNDWRNHAVVYEAERATQYDLPAMILVQRKDHGDALLKLLKARGIRAAFIFGENSQKERKQALDGLRSGAIQVLIGSTILDVGVDVPAIGMMILAGGGKAEVAHRQRIGRGLRAKKGAPNVCFVVDFNDEHNNHTRKHAMQRHNIVRTTPGFGENIIDEGADFDFAGLGFKKAA